MTDKHGDEAEEDLDAVVQEQRMTGWLMWMNLKRRPSVEVTSTLSLSTQRLKCSQRCNLKKWLPGRVMYIEQSGGAGRADAIVHKELLVCSGDPTAVCLRTPHSF